VSNTCRNVNANGFEHSAWVAIAIRIPANGNERIAFYSPFNQTIGYHGRSKMR
jgi:hypothetical protein